MVADPTKDLTREAGLLYIFFLWTDLNCRANADPTCAKNLDAAES